DIFVANGILKDLTDQDYVNFYASPRAISGMIKEDKGNVITQLVDMMPSEAIPNAAFMQIARSEGTIPQFADQAKDLGLGQPSFSNGSAYGDLDNDGDLDLVINNLDMPAFIYRNESDTLRKTHHYLSFQFKGAGSNTFALGTQVRVYRDDQIFYQELAPMRGFQSCIDPRLHFGLGELEAVDSIHILWPDMRMTRLGKTATNQMLSLDQREAKPEDVQTIEKIPTPLFTDYTSTLVQNFTHQENDYQDFVRERLLYHMLSSEGPKVAKGDVTGDGRADLYFCGAKDKPGELWIQQPNGTFKLDIPSIKTFAANASSEDTDAIFIDVDGDRDLDLYVASGGSEFSTASSALKDRLYLNQGKGKFFKQKNPFRGYIYESAACVRAGDYDGDGDQDLFVGVRGVPGMYGVPVNGVILNNDGKGNFTNVTQDVAPQLMKYGMLTDAQWMDWDGDRDLDLVVAGEWLPVTVWENQKGRFAPFIQNVPKQTGLWTCVEVGDFNEDGKPDLLIGNHGLNSRLQAGDSTPVEMWVNDFDRNGSPEQLISVYNGGQSYPLALRQDLVMQMPGLKKQYLKYTSYKDATVDQMFAPQVMERTIKWSAQKMETSVWMSQPDGTYAWKTLPLEAQVAPVYGMLVEDLDGDGHLDILLGGNFSRAKPEIGIYAASYGTFLKGNGKGAFTFIPNKEVGLQIKGEVRDIVSIQTDKGKRIVVARNDGPAQWLKINR
ncbi:MAG: FG-GAP-like repeat-containing protein, partial [Bacteroidota bacterium]